MTQNPDAKILIIFTALKKKSFAWAELYHKQSQMSNDKL